MQKTQKTKKAAPLSPEDRGVVYRWVDRERKIIKPVWTLLVKHDTFRLADVVKAIAAAKSKRTPQNVLYFWKHYGLIKEAKP